MYTMCLPRLMPATAEASEDTANERGWRALWAFLLSAGIHDSGDNEDTPTRLERQYGFAVPRLLAGDVQGQASETTALEITGLIAATPAVHVWDVKLADGQSVRRRCCLASSCSASFEGVERSHLVTPSLCLQAVCKQYLGMDRVDIFEQEVEVLQKIRVSEGEGKGVWPQLHSFTETQRTIVTMPKVAPLGERLGARTSAVQAPASTASAGTPRLSLFTLRF